MMICYGVYYRDYENRETEMLGALTERRKNPRRRSDLMQSAMKWARNEFGQYVNDPNAIYIVRKELNVKSPD